MNKNSNMDDFDYFGNQAVVKNIDALEQAAKDHNDTDLYFKIAKFKDHKRRERFNLFIMFLFLLLSAYYVFDLRSELSYHFGPAVKAVDLGAADTVDISKLRHNDYVTISGVTDYRAASIKRLRNLEFNVKEYHYFHLAGSRIFLEANSEENISPMQGVKVTGRVVDARLDSSFNSLLDFLRTKYLFNVGDNVRFIQVGQAPGAGQKPYLLVMLILALVWAINLFSFIRHHKKASRIIGPNLIGGAKRS